MSMRSWTERLGGMRVKMVSARHKPTTAPQPEYQFPVADERAFIEARQQQGTHAPQDDTQRTDKAHTAIGLVSLVLMASGAAIEWNVGYASMLVGGLLLAGIIYARTRTDRGAPPG